MSIIWRTLGIFFKCTFVDCLQRKKTNLKRMKNNKCWQTHSLTSWVNSLRRKISLQAIARVQLCRNNFLSDSPTQEFSIASASFASLDELDGVARVASRSQGLEIFAREGYARQRVWQDRTCQGKARQGKAGQGKANMYWSYSYV